MNPGSPNPVGEVCANGLDDNCNGATDEQPCTNGGGGGSGGTGGSGGSGGTGGSGGSGGSGGALNCTPVNNALVSVVGANSLTTLWGGHDAVASWANPRMEVMANEELLATASEAGLSSFTAAGALNFWEPYIGGGGNPTPLLDALFCRQIGVNPENPGSCNQSVIGDRRSTLYMAALLNDWQCWRLGGSYCLPTLVGHIPGDLFVLKKVVAVGDPLTGYTYAGTKYGILEMPPLCQ